MRDIMGDLWTPARPKMASRELGGWRHNGQLPKPPVVRIVALADEIDEKKAELAELMRAAELQELARFDRVQKIESGRLGSSLPELPNFNENED